MCGINGIIAKNEKGKAWFGFLSAANDALNKRGPDASGIYKSDYVCFGHRRLSIIDLSDAANQPMWDTSGKYIIVFNGEIFNFLDLKEALVKDGISFNTNSDTEVILELYKKFGTSFINKLNGFFSFAIHNTITGEILIVRDRYGVKPLWIYDDADTLIFSSELKGILSYPVNRELNQEAFYSYLHFNYVPNDISILKGITKLEPGNALVVNQGKSTRVRYYQIKEKIDSTITYEAAQTELVHLLDASVKRRLISDVPIGAFLSGGIDSSVIVALASRHTNHLNTFSIGYKNDSFYDETHYAELVAERYKTNHTVFKLTQDDVFSELNQILDYIDEPFADSSALPVYVLCKHTRQRATVALSGDGADELFGGYMKHWAEFRMRHPSFLDKAATTLSPLIKIFPRSRGNYLSNKLRQLDRFAEGAKMSAADRYLRWCSIGDEDYLEQILIKTNQQGLNRLKSYAEHIRGGNDLNDVFQCDMRLVLGGDMLVKVDLMSMANSLEVRTPFLDYTVVDFAFRLPSIYKVNRLQRKRMIQDAFKQMLPSELYNRPKKGFEVPLLEWMRIGMQERIKTEWCNRELIESQGLFSYEAIELLMKQLHSSSPGDSPAKLWAIIQFQNFWLKFMN